MVVLTGHPFPLEYLSIHLYDPLRDERVIYKEQPLLQNGLVVYQVTEESLFFLVC